MSMKKRADAQYATNPSSNFLCEVPALPKNMMVELSNACNHACVFCPNPDMQRKIGRIDKNLMFRIMAEAHAGGTSDIGFYTTGEPFIHKDLTAFTAEAKRIGFVYTYISTNGALATIERASKVIDAGMDSIKFSINAGSRETYAKIHARDEWDLVIGNLRDISNYRHDHAPNLKLYITCVVTQEMEHEVDSIQEMLGPLVDEIAFDHCTPLAFPDESWAAEGSVCNMPFNRMHVTYEGYLTLCCVDFQNYVAVADLNEMSVADAWASPAFRDIRRRHLDKDLSGTLCGNCWLGQSEHISPLNEDYADILDFDAFEKEQRQRVMEQLRIPERD
ncbi:MAG: radical SAM protein [Rhodospirillales bacterium]|nr:radical SAM protein [Rhodospirillales bacterium]